MNDREKWRERVRDIRATSTTWWWWWCSETKKLIENKLRDKKGERIMWYFFNNDFILLTMFQCQFGFPYNLFCYFTLNELHHQLSVLFPQSGRIYLSISVCWYLSIYLSTYISLFISIYLSIYPLVCSYLSINVPNRIP